MYWLFKHDKFMTAVNERIVNTYKVRDLHHPNLINSSLFDITDIQISYIMNLRTTHCRYVYIHKKPNAPDIRMVGIRFHKASASQPPRNNYRVTRVAERRCRTVNKAQTTNR